MVSGTTEPTLYQVPHGFPRPQRERKFQLVLGPIRDRTDDLGRLPGKQHAAFRTFPLKFISRRESLRGSPGSRRHSIAIGPRRSQSRCSECSLSWHPSGEVLTSHSSTPTTTRTITT